MRQNTFLSFEINDESSVISNWKIFSSAKVVVFLTETFQSKIKGCNITLLALLLLLLLLLLFSRFVENKKVLHLGNEVSSKRKENHLAKYEKEKEKLSHFFWIIHVARFCSSYLTSYTNTSKHSFIINFSFQKFV